MAKKKKKPAARPRRVGMMISIPDDFKRRLDKIEGVNWSAIARAAFEAKLSEINLQQSGVASMEDVINRLRESAKKAESESYERGFEEGKSWAAKVAEVTELRRLEKIEDYPWELGGTSAYSDAEILFFQIQPDADGDRDESERFWEHAFGDDFDTDDTDLLRGFAEGALQVWNEVKGKL